MNRVTLLGRVGKEVELKYIPSGAAVANFSIATSEKWKDKQGQKQESTEWHKIVMWGKIAELASKYLTKGSQVLLTGKNVTRSWDGKDGVKKYITEVVVSDMEFIGSGKDTRNDENTGADQAADKLMNTDSAFTSDDVPF